MKILLEKSEWLDDWYTIVRAKHDGRQWLERAGSNGMKFMCSERISDACVEGTSEEMMQIAKAIKTRSSASFKRCAVWIKGDIAYFCSPRNSTIDAEVALEDADAFAESVIAQLRTPCSRGSTTRRTDL